MSDLEVPQQRASEMNSADRHAIIDVFAGIGCVARGFTRGGPFDAVYLNDIDPVAEEAYLANAITGAVYECKDIRDVRAEDIRSACDGRQVVGLLGCPPCQGWSSAGTRNPNDPRNALMGNFFELVRTLRPTFVLMENVPAVAGRPELHTALVDAGREYRWWSGVLNAAAYGLPQTRQRALIVGYHCSTGVNPSPPTPTHAGKRAIWSYTVQDFVSPSIANIDGLLGGAPRLSASGIHSMADFYDDEMPILPALITVEEAIGDLSETDYRLPSAYAARLGAAAGARPTGHVPWNHNRDLVTRMGAVPEGGAPQAPLGAQRYYSQAYARLHRRGLARTVTTNFHNPGSGRFTHYSHPRVITPREAARLQGIDDFFVLSGYPSYQERLIGNAFPPLWAEAIARHVARELGTVFASL